MNIHKNTRLTPHNRQAIWRAYTQDKQSVTSLAAEYKVSRPTIYRILKAARLKLLVPQIKHQQPLQTSQIRYEASGQGGAGN